MSAPVMGIPPGFAWSFSKLALFMDCPYAFYLRYILHPTDDTGMENAFGQYGTLGHKLIEEWAKGQLAAQDMAKEWDERYPRYITASFPPFPRDMPLKSYQAGLEYFKNFNGFGDIEILEVEEKFSINFGPHVFHGIADLVYRERDTGKLVIMDHKSKSASSMKKDFPIYKQQLYLYAAHVMEKFGDYPDVLKFNMFKAGTMIDIPFDLKDYVDALRWATDIIEEAYMTDEWEAHFNSYRCSFICDMRDECDVIEGG